MTLLLFASALCLALAPAQSDAALTGRWDVRVEAARQETPAGGSRSRSALSLVLDLTVRDGVATGGFTGLRGERVTLSGTWKDGRLDLASEWREADITHNGRPAKGKLRWLIKGSLKDGVLGGTWDFQLGDSTLPQRWRGTKQKAG
jgi:hypothetical protein